MSTAGLVDQEENTKLKTLRSALAINRGMEFLETIGQEVSQQTLDHYANKRAEYLGALPERIHRALFKDWQNQPDTLQPGVIMDADKRDQLRTAIGTLLGDKGGAISKNRLFDSHGMGVGTGNREERRAKCAEILADFYAKLRAIRPFEYGNKLTTDFFMVALGKLPAFSRVHGDIDFRRITEEEKNKLHDQNSSASALVEIFKHALDPNRTPLLENEADRYHSWGKNEISISGIRFLSHKDTNKKEYLVTVNGGLVPVESIRQKLESHIKSEELLANFKIPNNKITSFLQGTESLRQGDYDTASGPKYIDGFKVTQEEAPLVCLDVNILTGLRKPSHDKLLNLLEHAEGKGTSLHRLNKNPELKQALLQLAGNDETLRKIVDTAYEHVNAITHQLDAAKLEVFKDKQPTEQPAFWMSMGGAASGKSRVERMMRDTYDNIVVASLDAFREKSGLFQVLKAADHHADDYSLIEPFGSTLRDWVAAHARGERAHQHESRDKYNLLFDGTGIAYQPRYGDLVQKFKGAGFSTQIVAIDRPYDEVIEGVKNRARPDHEGRALPWSVVAGKHARMPRSMLQAIEDPNVDKMLIYANNGKHGGFELLAETGNSGTEHDSNGFRHNGDSRAAQLHYIIKGKERVLAIHNVEGFNRILGKALMNSQASNPDDVYKVPSEELAFLPRAALWVDKLVKAPRLSLHK